MAKRNLKLEVYLYKPQWGYPPKTTQVYCIKLSISWVIVYKLSGVWQIEIKPVWQPEKAGYKLEKTRLPYNKDLYIAVLEKIIVALRSEYTDLQARIQTALDQ